MKWMFACVSGILWLCMEYFLFQKEIMPYLEYQIPPSYKTYLKRKIHPEIKHARVYIGQVQIGTFRMHLVPDPDMSYRINTELNMMWQIFVDKKIRIELNHYFEVDPEFQLRKFDGYLMIWVDSMPITFSINGYKSKDNLIISYKTPMGGATETIDWPRDLVLSDTFVPFWGSDFLAVGKKWVIRSVDFLSAIFEKQLKIIHLYAFVDEAVIYKTSTGEVPAYKIDIKKDPTRDIPDYTILVDMQGEVLEEIAQAGRFEIRFVFERY